MTSNTNKELYDWAWGQYYRGNEIDILINELKRNLKAYELIRQSPDYVPGYHKRNMSIDVGYASLIIEALENIR